MSNYAKCQEVVDQMVTAYINEKSESAKALALIAQKEFEEWKEDNDYEEWDYPLEEYEHIAENEIKCVPVRFNGMSYDYRFCEIP
jgi:hypothetical protein